MMNKRKVVKEIRSWVLLIFSAFCIAIVFNSKVSAKVQVRQSSMETTLFAKQQLILDKLSYVFSEPKRGDIIIFLESEKKGNIIDDTLRTIDDIKLSFDKNEDVEELHRRLVKRVIGIEGDEIDIKDGSVYLNGFKLDEPYVNGETLSGKIEFPIIVGENKLFVLGDNRIVSADSREFGVIDCNQVEGKAIYRVYPFDEIGKIK